MHPFSGLRIVSCSLAAMLAASTVTAAPPATLELKPEDTIVLIGNTLAERMQYDGHWETLLHARFPQHKLVVRDLGWSADELTLRPRSQDFQNHGHRLEDHKPDVIIAMFGYNESFGGEKGLPKFEQDLTNFIKETTATNYNGESPPRLVLVTPIANEDRTDRKILAGTWNNERIQMYAAAMQKVAAAHDVQCVDVFTPTQSWFLEADGGPFTMNGCHLNDAGSRGFAGILDAGLFGPISFKNNPALLAAVQEKNLQFFYDYRAVNGFYIYGGRKEPFGVVNFPAEFAKLRKMITVRDERIWNIAAGQAVPETIDDSATGEFTPIETNFASEVHLTDPEESRQQFTLPEGFQVNLYASEVDFPNMMNPVSFTFDARWDPLESTCRHASLSIL